MVYSAIKFSLRTRLCYHWQKLCHRLNINSNRAHAAFIKAWTLDMRQHYYNKLLPNTIRPYLIDVVHPAPVDLVSAEVRQWYEVHRESWWTRLWYKPQSSDGHMHELVLVVLLAMDKHLPDNRGVSHNRIPRD
jgi:hypothetical protein